jgi:hypothetical protein
MPHREEWQPVNDKKDASTFHYTATFFMPIYRSTKHKEIQQILPFIVIQEKHTLRYNNT